MRPLLLQAGHLAAEPAPNTSTIVDRYRKARRTVAKTEAMAMDAAIPPPQPAVQYIALMR